MYRNIKTADEQIEKLMCDENELEIQFETDDGYTEKLISKKSKIFTL